MMSFGPFRPVRRRLKPPPILRSHNECRFDRESSLTLQRWRLGRPTSLGIQIAAVDSAHDVAAEPAYRQTQPEFVVRRLRMTAAKLGKSDLLHGERQLGHSTESLHR